MAGSLTVDNINGDDISGGFLGHGQTWQNFTFTREDYTTYTNTTGKPIFVCVRDYHPVNTIYDVAIIVDGQIVQTNGGQGGHDSGVSAIVPNGSTYYTAGYSGAGWYELR